jgi:hypothetical protein
MSLKTGLCIGLGMVFVAGSGIGIGVAINDERQKNFEDMGTHPKTRRELIKHLGEGFKHSDKVVNDAIELKQAEFKREDELFKAMEKNRDLISLVAKNLNKDGKDITPDDIHKAGMDIMEKEEGQRTQEENKIAKKLKKPYERFVTVHQTVINMFSMMTPLEQRHEASLNVLLSMRDLSSQDAKSAKSIAKLIGDGANVADNPLAKRGIAKLYAAANMLLLTDKEQFKNAQSELKKDPLKLAAKFNELCKKQQAKEAENAKAESQPESPQPANK